MILFTLLAVLAFISIGIIALAIIFGGGLFLIIFGDVIVCMFILSWIFRKRTKKSKKDKEAH